MTTEPTEKEVREAAFALASLAGGALRHGGMSHAFIVGTTDGWWHYGVGAHNGDCVYMFAERHWHEYKTEARAALRAAAHARQEEKER